MSEPDDLFTLRNHFWLGSYQLAIAEGSGLGRLPESLRVERDEFIYRSYLALGQYSIVLEEVRGVEIGFARALVPMCPCTWFCTYKLFVALSPRSASRHLHGVPSAARRGFETLLRHPPIDVRGSNLRCSWV